LDDEIFVQGREGKFKKTASDDEKWRRFE
jgi:hypothetical protein